MSELSDYKRLVEAPAIRSYEATINSLRAEVEKLQSALSVTQEEGRTEIARLEADIEKLKAEADPEALVIAHMHGAQMATEKHRDEIAKLKAERDEARAEITHWFDLAGFNMRGGGFHSYKEEAARLTSQLEQAERVIAPLYFDSTNVPFAIPDRRPLWMRADNGKYVELLHTTVGTLRAASQWIKDRQAKTDVAIGDK